MPFLLEKIACLLPFPLVKKLLFPLETIAFSFREKLSFPLKKLPVCCLFNNIKRDGIPKQWNKVNIKTLYKNKGSKKNLENYRGIFLTEVFSKLMEKYIISESTVPINNISKYQAGSRPNRSASDQLYLIGAVIDHAKYLKRSVYLVLYDFKQCFDSLWLEDCLVSLKNIGVNKELI